MQSCPVTPQTLTHNDMQCQTTLSHLSIAESGFVCCRARVFLLVVWKSGLVERREARRLRNCEPRIVSESEFDAVLVPLLGAEIDGSRGTLK